MLDFVLVVYFDAKMQQGEYVGHFASCAHANQYLEEHKEYKDRIWDKCLDQDYLFLPPDLIKKFPKLHGTK